MRRKKGSLLARMDAVYRAEQNTKNASASSGSSIPDVTAALVIDEESSTRPREVDAAQGKVLEKVRAYRWPVIFVQYWRGVELSTTRPEPRTLADAYPCTNHINTSLWKNGDYLFTKTCPSAFGVAVIKGLSDYEVQPTWVNFDHELQRMRVRRLIVLGTEANLCVKATLIGGVFQVGWVEKEKLWKPSPGAIQRGYGVLTCDDIVWGTNLGRAKWLGEADNGKEEGEKVGADGPLEFYTGL